MRWMAAMCAFALAASAQTLTVQKLVTAVRNEIKTNSDAEIAKFLAGVKLTERLDDRTITELQSAGAGIRTLHALWKLRDDSKNLPAPAAAAVAGSQPKTAAPPTAEEQAGILDEARQYALDYSRNLPDFICTQWEKRFEAPIAASGDPAWHKVDDLVGRLTYFQQREEFKPTTIDGRLTTRDYSKLGGSKSFGDFGTMMRQIFEPATEARFEWEGWGAVDARRVMKFRYHVALDRSQYHLIAEDVKRDIVTAYSGEVAVDPKSHAVLMVSVAAENIPADFPIRAAQTILTYGEQDLSGRAFLLPAQATVIMSGGDFATKNEKSFVTYRKFSADSEISFGDPGEKPVPPVKKK